MSLERLPKCLIKASFSRLSGAFFVFLAEGAWGSVRGVEVGGEGVGVDDERVIITEDDGECGGVPEAERTIGEETFVRWPFDTCGELTLDAWCDEPVVVTVVGLLPPVVTVIVLPFELVCDSALLFKSKRYISI